MRRATHLALSHGEAADAVHPSQEEEEQQEQEQEQEECLDRLSLVASSEECDQLLRLAEVEHILGAACLQLGLAAAAEVKTQRNAQSPSSSPRQPAPEAALGIALLGVSRGLAASKTTVAEAAAGAAGGRMSWGFGAGPFAEVFATKSEIFSGGRESGGEHGDGDLGDVDDDAIIAQLEVHDVSSEGHFCWGLKFRGISCLESISAGCGPCVFLGLDQHTHVPGIFRFQRKHLLFFEIANFEAMVK